MAWLMREKGMLQTAAQDYIMSQFPGNFYEAPSVRYIWNPNAVCTQVFDARAGGPNSSTAGDRMRWLMCEKGLSQQDAQYQVYNEFPPTLPLLARKKAPLHQGLCCIGCNKMHRNLSRGRGSLHTR